MAENMDRIGIIAKDEGFVAPTAHPVDEPKYETRQDAARRACEEIGIVWPATILPPGTALYQSGIDALKSDRARWAKLPDAATAIPVITAALAAEDRKDVVVPMNELRLAPENGRLYRAGTVSAASAAGYDKHSFRQLVAQTPGCGAGEAPRSFASALLYLENDERAAVMNRRLPKALTGGGKNGKDAPVVTLRTKIAHSGNRIVRAVLSEKYGDLNDMHVGEALTFALNGDARVAKLDYKPGDSRSKFEVIFPSQVPVKTFVVGDVHYAGIIIENSETGEGAANVRAFLMRAACANLTLAPGNGISIRHIGKSERLKGAMRAAVQAALMQIDPLVDLIQKTAGEKLTDLSAKSPSEIIRMIAKKYEVKDESRVQSWVSTYESKYAQSPTTWGVTSAITEAAQGADWWATTAEEEKVAAEVVSVGLRKALGF